MGSNVSIAIVGSGIAGTTLARLLTDDSPSTEVTIFEKSRGVGGRMATRYSEQLEFDHHRGLISSLRLFLRLCYWLAIRLVQMVDRQAVAPLSSPLLIE